MVHKVHDWWDYFPFQMKFSYCHNQKKFHADRKVLIQRSNSWFYDASHLAGLKIVWLKEEACERVPYDNVNGCVMEGFLSD